MIDKVKSVLTRDHLEPVFASLGFTPYGRHWRRGDLFVEVPSLTLDDPADEVRLGHFSLRVISKEALLADRVVGFRHWETTAYGQQAIDMLAAFGDDLREDILQPRLVGEGAVDAFEALRALAQSPKPVTHESLTLLLQHLKDSSRTRN